MLKTRFGHYLRSRAPHAQYAESMLRCVYHNVACLVHAVQELRVEPKVLDAVAGRVAALREDPMSAPVDLTPKEQTNARTALKLVASDPVRAVGHAGNGAPVLRGRPRQRGDRAQGRVAHACL
jgi:hypothetical protein